MTTQSTLSLRLASNLYTSSHACRVAFHTITLTSVHYVTYLGCSI